jgi:hypothetical protein
VLRTNAGLSQRQLAERARCNVFTVAKLERGILWSWRWLAFVGETEVKETVQTKARGRAKRGRS